MRAERDRRDDEVREYFAARAQSMRRTAYVVVRDWHTAEDMRLYSGAISLRIGLIRLRAFQQAMNFFTFFLLSSC